MQRAIYKEENLKCYTFMDREPVKGANNWCKYAVLFIHFFNFFITIFFFFKMCSDLEPQARITFINPCF